MSSKDCEYVGECLWFNNQRGIGFVRVLKRVESCDNGECLLNIKDDEVCVKNEVFVHYSDLSVSVEARKYLRQNEKVRFKLGDSLNKEGKMKAIEIKGVFGGALECEMPRTSPVRRFAPSTSERRDDRQGGRQGGRRDDRQSGRRDVRQHSGQEQQSSN